MKMTDTQKLNALLAQHGGKSQWKKCLSVVPGGKPHFYYRRNEKLRRHEWISWNRKTLIWEWSI